MSDTTDRDDGEEADEVIKDTFRIDLDSETYEIDEVITKGVYLPIIRSGKMEFYVADEERVRDATEQYWRDMAERDADELIALVGSERIVAMWINGQSFEDWLSDMQSSVEEQWASYDGYGRDVTWPVESDWEMMEEGYDEDEPEIIQALGFWPTLAYRLNN